MRSDPENPRFSLIPPADRRRRVGPRTLAIGAAGAALGAAVAAQRRHLRAIARDPDYVRLTAPLAGRALEVASADGTVLHAEVFGAAEGPTVILAHGWTEQLSFWGPVITRLARRGLRLVAYDLRGHGASAPGAGGDYSLARFGEDLAAVLAAALDDGERATVVGHSLGAMSIAAWAERHDIGARASAAALVNTGLGDLMTGHLLFGEVAKRLNPRWAGRAVLGSRARLPPFSTPLSQAMVRYTAFGPTATAGEVAFYERMLIATPADVRSAVGVALSQMDLWHAVARLTVPTLVIAGASDRLTPPAHARRIAAELPFLTELIELPQTGHMSPLERPDEVAEAVWRLVDAVAAAARDPRDPRDPVPATPV
ncbi:MAG: alpha/beta hydrolase [Solirubrobacteraceae bacterium]